MQDLKFKVIDLGELEIKEEQIVLISFLLDIVIIR